MSRRRDSGLTLIEMMVALAVIAGITAMAVPFLGKSRGTAAVRLAAREIAGELREARSNAVSHNRIELFAANVDDAAFQVKSAGETRHLPPGVAMTLYTTIDQVEPARQATIRFYPDGSSTGGGVKLSQNGREIAILVDWLTGKARIIDAKTLPAPAR
jgi:general secretion pathway protein H